MRIILIIAFCLTACSVNYVGVERHKGIIEVFDVLPGQSLLVVKVKHVESAGYHPNDCDDDAGSEEYECIPMGFWYLYEAEVLDVIAGKFNKSRLDFAAFHHSYYTEDVTNELYILIEESDNEFKKELGVKYKVIQFDAKAFYID